MRTSDSLSPTTAPAVTASLTVFIIVYFFVFGAAIYHLLRMMNKPGKEIAEKALRNEGPLQTSGITPAAQFQARKMGGPMLGLERPFIWAGIIAFAVLVYVILDGFDLEIGLLFPLTQNEEDRSVMMNSVSPV